MPEIAVTLPGDDVIRKYDMERLMTAMRQCDESIAEFNRQIETQMLEKRKYHGIIGRKMELERIDSRKNGK